MAEFDLTVAPSFLLALELLVRKEPVSGLVGEVAIGIQRPGDTVWWWVRLGRRVESGFVWQPPTGAQAMLLIGERDAEQIVAGGFPAAFAIFDVKGDRELMLRFLSRYGLSRTWLDLRQTNRGI